jgi:hypothetical protein
VGHRTAHRADLVDATVGLHEALVHLLLVLGEGVVQRELGSVYDFAEASVWVVVSV